MAPIRERDSRRAERSLAGELTGEVGGRLKSTSSSDSLGCDESGAALNRPKMLVPSDGRHAVSRAAEGKQSARSAAARLSRRSTSCTSCLDRTATQTPAELTRQVSPGLRLRLTYNEAADACWSGGPTNSTALVLPRFVTCSGGDLDNESGRLFGLQIWRCQGATVSMAKVTRRSRCAACVTQSFSRFSPPPRCERSRSSRRRPPARREARCRSHRAARART